MEDGKLDLIIIKIPFTIDNINSLTIFISFHISDISHLFIE